MCFPLLNLTKAGHKITWLFGIFHTNITFTVANLTILKTLISLFTLMSMFFTPTFFLLLSRNEAEVLNNRLQGGASVFTRSRKCENP